MADVLVQFDEPIVGRNGVPYTARVCGREVEGGSWEGWLEFIPRVEGEPLRTGRETTQPNRADLSYWASGLTRVYLEGALDRALRPLDREPRVELMLEPIFSGPADSIERFSTADAPPRTVLDPFAVYAQGESILRQELSALSADHLENIISAYALYPIHRTGRRNEDDLVTQIVSAVRERRAG
jgi:hypothetical protein